MGVSEQALRRIEAAHKYGAIYRAGLASHHPMAITALDAMGATAAQMDAFEAGYLPKLEPMPSVVEPIAGDAEAAHLGSARSFPAWVDYFTAAIAAQGADAVLRHWIDRLTPAVASGAFHGAIRAAFALESGARDELAHGLAYWAVAYYLLPATPAPSGTRSPIEVLATLAADPAFAGKRPAGNGIISRAAAAARHPDFGQAVASLDPARLTLDAIAQAMLGTYAASGDFAMLHGVTGTHAFRLLAAYSSDPRAALKDLWTAAVAVYLGAGAPRVDGWGLNGVDDLPWPEIHARAVRCEDEHDIKLAYSCWREWQHRGDDLYRRAASARVAHAVEAA